VKRVQYQLDLDSTEPIYQQLSTRIMEDIRRGVLPRGSKLPTVRDFAEELGLARGTIKRAYDELERLGAIEMTQGRGSYVCWQEENTASRRVRAMRAIDDMLDQLEGLGFTPAEISIFLELKQRDRMETEHQIPLALVSSCEETLQQAAQQLKTLPGVELFTYSLKALRAVSGKLAEENCLVVTDDFLFDVVRGMVGDDDRIIRVAYEPTMETVRELSRIPAGSRQRPGSSLWARSKRWIRPSQIVGTPSDRVGGSSCIRSSRSSGCRCGPGKTILVPVITAP
jgi:DNA-binding transcriptional regulator YhcF (GntR family)